MHAKVVSVQIFQYLRQIPPRGCTLVLFIFSVFINELLKEVEQTGLGIQLNSGETVGGMLFADDFVGNSDSKESLQKLTDVVYSYCSKWRL